MKIKKIITLITASLLLLTLSNAAFAISVDTLTDAETFAYMDILTAPKELKELILEARNTIIFSTCWVADGCEAVIYSSSGEVEEIVPQFSDLFPGWDIPVLPLTPSISDTVSGLGTASASALSSITDYYYSIPLVNPPSSTNTPIFSASYYLPSYLKTTVLSLSPMSTCNVGYTNMSTGGSLFWAPDLYPGQYAWFTATASLIIGVRASTYGTSGTGDFSVYAE